jgi:hypothetical protein
VNEFKELQEAHAALESQWREQRAEIIKLEAAIRQTLDENGHLADGDDCTLIHLKTAIGYEDEEEI